MWLMVIPVRCPAEALQAEALTRALQGWLNWGPFRMTRRLDEPTECYSRGLRTVYRLRPDDCEDRLADLMRREGGARGYWGGGRGGGVEADVKMTRWLWCILSPPQPRVLTKTRYLRYI